MRTMIYAGVNRGDGFFPRVGFFDLAIGFEANPCLCVELKRMVAERGLRHVRIINAALCDCSGLVAFNINNNDCTSSIGAINPAVHPKVRTIKKIHVKSINLCEFLVAQGIDHVDFYLSDLQGMDLTVLKTLKPLLDEKKIGMLQCEVGKEDKPWVYVDLYNGYSGFKKLLSRNYKKIEHRRVEEHHTEDIIWGVKSCG